MDRRFEFDDHRTTRIVIGSGTEAQLSSLVGALDADGAVVLHDEAVSPVAARVAEALGARARIPIAGGEACKALDNVGELARALRAAGATRGTALVAIGGGTITDVAGFLASIYLRGVPCVLCPTTTLAMADAALGGKNGVNHGGLKNELGTIRQPELIVGDVDWLTTLTDELFLEGIVEIVKKAAVLDAASFERLEILTPDIVARRQGATLEAIEMSIRMKMEVVLGDAREGDRRRWLNFGHTIGHAIESRAAGALRHGACVAMGMLAECRAAESVVPKGLTDRLTASLRRLGVPTAIPKEFAHPSGLWALACQDKKSKGASVPMVVPSRLGQGVVFQLTAESLARALA